MVTFLLEFGLCVWGHILALEILKFGKEICVSQDVFLDVFPLSFFFEHDGDGLHGVFDQDVGIVVLLDFTEISSVELVELLDCIGENGLGLFQNLFCFRLQNQDFFGLHVDVIGLGLHHFLDLIGL